MYFINIINKSLELSSFQFVAQKINITINILLKLVYAAFEFSYV